MKYQEKPTIIEALTLPELKEVAKMSVKDYESRVNNWLREEHPFEYSFIFNCHRIFVSGSKMFIKCEHALFEKKRSKIMLIEESDIVIVRENNQGIQIVSKDDFEKKHEPYHPMANGEMWLYIEQRESALAALENHPIPIEGKCSLVSYDGAETKKLNISKALKAGLLFYCKVRYGGERLWVIPIKEADTIGIFYGILQSFQVEGNLSPHALLQFQASDVFEIDMNYN